jgi:tRNA 2-thiouridine synthesizing protein E
MQTPKRTAQTSGSTLHTPNGDVIFDSEGFLLRPEEWSETLARLLAAEVGLETLTDRHWEVLHALRTFYFSRGKAPTGAELKAATGLGLLEIKALFPGGLKFGARRIAGIPNPRGCL